MYGKSGFKGNHMRCFLDCYDWKYTLEGWIGRVSRSRSFRKGPINAIGIYRVALLEAAEAEAARMEAMVLSNGRKFYNIVSKGSYHMADGRIDLRSIAHIAESSLKSPRC